MKNFSNLRNFPKRSKRSQAQEIFVFIMALILVAFILVFGYKAISGFMKDIQKTSLIEFQTKLESTVKKMSSNYGSVDRLDLQIPKDVTKICFLQQGYTGEKISTQLCGGDLGDSGDFGKQGDYDLTICNLWPEDTSQENVFLLPISETISIKTVQLEIENGYLCLKPVAGQISLRLEGKGDHTKLSKWPRTIT